MGPAGEKAGSAPVFDDGHGFEIASHFTQIARSLPAAPSGGAMFLFLYE